MTPLYKKYSHSEFDENGVLNKFTLNCPDNFNFAYDVVDEIAKEEPERTALVWCDVEGNEKTIKFGEMSELSSKAANFLYSQGIRKGDRVMVILKRHYEYWYTVLALHKIGAILIDPGHGGKDPGRLRPAGHSHPHHSGCGISRTAEEYL